MNEIPLQMHMLRSFKGAPLAVLMALWIDHNPQPVKWLQRQTGYGDEAVMQALELLDEYHLVNRIGRYAWQYCGDAHQFPLGKAMLEVGEEKPATEIIDTVEDLPLFQIDPGISGVPAEINPVPEGTPEKTGSDPGNSGVPLSSSSRSFNLDSKKDLLLARADAEKSGILQILDQFGVREPKRSRLANQFGITDRAVLYHLTTAKTVALAIYRLENRWRVPEGWQPVTPLDLNNESLLPIPQEGGEKQTVPAEQAEAFGRVLECLRANIPVGVWAGYSASMRLALPVETGKVQISVANSSVIRQMEPYQGDLVRCLESEFGTPVEIDFVIE